MLDTVITIIDDTVMEQYNCLLYSVGDSISSYGIEQRSIDSKHALKAHHPL